MNMRLRRNILDASIMINRVIIASFVLIGIQALSDYLRSDTFIFLPVIILMLWLTSKNNEARCQDNVQILERILDARGSPAVSDAESFHYKLFPRTSKITSAYNK